MSANTLRGDDAPQFSAKHVAIGGGWKRNCIVATQGPQTFLGNVLLAIMGRAPTFHRPRIVGAAEITVDGIVVAPVQWEKHGPGQSGITHLCTSEELRDDFRRLADFLHLDDGEREAMNIELRSWIKVDHRVKTDLSLPGNLKEV